MGIKLSNGKIIWLWFIDVFFFILPVHKVLHCNLVWQQRVYSREIPMLPSLALNEARDCKKWEFVQESPIWKKSKFLGTFRRGICYIEKDWQLVMIWKERWTGALKSKRPYLIQTAVMHISCFLHKSYPHIKTLKMVFWRSLNLLFLSQINSEKQKKEI